jgi:Spy/CpxP family protein refolding chaperone
MSPNQRKALGLVLLASLAFNVGVGATVGVRAYQHVREPDDDKHGKHPGRWLRQELNLTAEQQESFDAARTDLMTGLRDLRAQIKGQHDQLADMMAEAEPDRQGIDEQISKVSALHEEMQRRLVEHFLDLKPLLDPDQQKKFNETIHRVMSRHGHKHRGHGGHGGRRHRNRGDCGPKGRFHSESGPDSPETEETQ